MKVRLLSLDNPSGQDAGFTLIEMSIVLVIIGLIIGGILTGRDLIASATLRAQITQMEKFNTAVRTFQNKYGGLPGDLLSTSASMFGFQVTNCGVNQPGNRDGNGYINGAYGYDDPVMEGENLLFWQDLSAANLIEGSYPNSGGSTSSPCNQGFILSLTPGTAYIGDFYPVAKIGNGNFIYVFDSKADGGGPFVNGSRIALQGDNWYGVSAVTATVANGGMTSSPAVSVMQAYDIDKKIDDGLPASGHVMPVYATGYVLSSNAQVSDSATSCWNYTANTYSTGINGGNGLNCSLSFQFQ